MGAISKYLPILAWLPNYKRGDLRGDLFAGITVGVMLIPQGMAYALIAGLPPVYGLYASIVPQIIYAFFGTSRQLSVGPVAMDSLLVAAGVSLLATEGSDAYIAFAIMLALFMGIFQITLGVLRLGFITNLLSKPVISGFTSAAAIIIGFNQIKYLLGVEVVKSNRIYEVVINSFSQIGNTHLLTLILGIAGMIIIKLSKRLHKNIPGALVAVVFGTVAISLMGAEYSGVSIVREIPQGLPDFVLPKITLEKVVQLAPLALTISVVAFMEAFSVAKAIEAKRHSYKVLPNQELVGLGAANLIGALFQAYPVTGGFSRSAVNDQAGANTPLAAIFSAVLVGLTLIFLTPLFYYLPHTILAAIIMMAVSNLFDFTYAKKLFFESRREFFILLATFIVTLNIGMVQGIVSGVILSLLLFLYQAAYPHIAILGKIKGHSEYRNIKRFQNLETWDNVIIIRIDAPFSFINIQGIKEYIEEQAKGNAKAKYVVIDASPVNHLDATAAEGLSDLLDDLNLLDMRLVFCEVKGPVRDKMKLVGLTDKIGSENFYLSLNEAVDSVLKDTGDPFHEMTLQTNEDT